MKLFAILGGLAALLSTAPALAQPVYVAPAGSGERPANGVVARSADAIQAPVPESGTADYRILTADGKCLVPQMRDGKVYLLRPGPCIDGVLLNARFYGNQRARLELDGSGTCVAIRQLDYDGSGLMYRTWGKGVGTAPCGEGLELRFRIDHAEGGMVSIRTIDGNCWHWADTGVRELPCDRSPNQRFRLSQRSTAVTIADGRVVPAGDTPRYAEPIHEPLGVARPVEVPADPAPATEPTPEPTPAPRERPAGLPDLAPLPGINQVASLAGYACLNPVRRGTDAWLLRAGACNDASEWENLQLEYQEGAFVIYVPSISGKCLAGPRAGRPWAEFEACETPAADQRFQIARGDGGAYTIRTAAGLCLTLRGNASAAANNSALFPEPCRTGADEQRYELRLMIDQRDL
ncbi:hypothetical protein P1X14_19690 [Sphingomonas sp. AOB5]|uniref:RICIN domain-containing protein n=1 Tax=Sphingomonas sp. AOB5 TaxID=3034017 RepID=UPI0023F796EA|nr:hypothetical protein [Sphingomonas sp. AOB5]MDF7777490.1 hypothetical protein [Sphingomonas sp. AOB5]